ncbi:hypothetical protein [Streptomyces griseus]
MSARQLKAQESAAHRTELKDAVLKFLGVAAQVEKTALPRTKEVGRPVGR